MLIEKGRGDGLEFGKGVDVVELAAERGRVGAASEVVEEMRPYESQQVVAERGHMVVWESSRKLRVKLDQVGDMVLEHGVLARNEDISGRSFAAGLQVSEEPRVLERGAPDHDGGNAGQCHQVGRRAVVDVAVSSNRNLGAPDEFGDEVVVDFAAVLLRGEAAVEGQSRAAGRFGGIEKLEHDDLVGRRAGARLERDRQVRLGADSRQAVADNLRIPYHRRAVAALDDARHRATGVEVDGDESLEGGHLARREGQLVWNVPEQLTGDRTFARQDLQ